ncbi:MAG: glutathione S-transferase family protein [Pseudomonadota bacterium]
MTTLYHLPLDTTSRFVRLTLAEYGEAAHEEVERVWERRRGFLSLNPAATVPVIKTDEDVVLVGAHPLVGHLVDTLPDKGAPLMPIELAGRAEVRRLIDWALTLLEADVSATLVHEKAHKRQIPDGKGGGSPDTAAMRMARDHLGWHLDYLDHLLATRDWLAGDRMTLADLAFGAALSSLDYLGEVPWAEHTATKLWYARVKSRPSFAPLLAERERGVVPPAHYDDPDF